MFPANTRINEQESKTPWIAENNKKLRALFECLENRNCGENQAKVIILGSYHFSNALVGGTGAEDSWARSITQGLQHRGFTYLITAHYQRAIQLYQTVPDLVRAVFLQPEEVQECFDDKEFCVLSDGNPDGIPIWKIFALHWWADVRHPLGPLWQLQPEDYSMEHSPKSTYIGYSVEKLCRLRRFTPAVERNKQAFIMAKWIGDFAPGPDTAWSVDYYETASSELGIQFVAGANHRNEDAAVELPASIVNLGQMAQIDFQHHIGFSQVLIGAGRPPGSPTPYEALCLGVPFINPILEWDHENPSDKSKWKTQHSSLALLAPPYVYNVRRDDRDGFVKAIKDAVENPIPSYILPRMRIYSVALRLDNLMHSNWQRGAAVVLERRKNGEEQGPVCRPVSLT
ncbi:hypothetical protein FIBSPDRAFT_724484 [Athelia psychrophila]|uniref:Glycosyltransferase family 18 catalytic domain-containing protein n=1 Tax=Athelia psychrophila TaxID=1759441 RepID=A0A166UBJ8_9AGAM|nr:hypothetical protein FIBSPDRAFT_724484 [Fibularhizoctonia sp. CBS 109695]